MVTMRGSTGGGRRLVITDCSLRTVIGILIWLVELIISFSFCCRVDLFSRHADIVLDNFQCSTLRNRERPAFMLPGVKHLMKAEANQLHYVA